MPNLQDVALEAGVSISTVSRVLNGATLCDRVSGDVSERVRAAARRLGYVGGYHRRAIRSGKTETLGVVIDQTGPAPEPNHPSALLQPFYGEVIAGVEQATHAAGYNLALIVPSRQERANLRGRKQLEEKRIDGLVLPPCNRSPENTQTLRESPLLPIVSVLPPVETRLPCFFYDMEDAITQLIGHLHGLGHRELLYIGPEVGRESNVTAEQRQQYFFAAACRLGIKGDSFLHERPPRNPHNPTDPLVEARYREEAVQRWLKRRESEGTGRGVTGIVCFNDVTAVSVCRVLARHGIRVPQDMSVTGFDSLPPDHMQTSLTSIDARLVDLGIRAGRLVVELAEGGEKAVAAHRGFREVIQARLVVRESTGPAPSDRPNA